MYSGVGDMESKGGTRMTNQQQDIEKLLLHPNPKEMVKGMDKRLRLALKGLQSKRDTLSAKTLGRMNNV